MSKQTIYNRVTGPVWVLIVLMIVHCGDPIPVEEMASARAAYQEAVELGAEKYAAETLEKSQKSLLSSHDSIEKGEMEPAKKSAVNAESLAKQAYQETLPLLYEEKRAQAETEIEKAEQANAEEYSPTEFARSKELYGEAESKKESETEAAIETIDQASMIAQEAFAKSQNQAGVIREELNMLKDLITKAGQVNADKVANEALVKALALHNTGVTALEGMKLKSASASAKEGIELAEQALATGKEYWAKSRYEEAKVVQEQAVLKMTEFTAEVPDEILFAEVKDTDFHDAFRTANETLDAGTESITLAKSNFDQGEFDESYQQSSEAMRIFSLIDGQMPDLAERLTALQNASKEEVTVATREVDQDDPENADDELLPGWKSYTVQYRKKNTDCLWRIASYSYIYNDAKLWPKIYKANMSQIKNPDLIFPGQKFRIPPKDYNPDNNDQAGTPKDEENIDKPSDDAKVLTPEQLSNESSSESPVSVIEAIEDNKTDKDDSEQNPATE